MTVSTGTPDFDYDNVTVSEALPLVRGVVRLNWGRCRHPLMGIGNGQVFQTVWLMPKRHGKWALLPAGFIALHDSLATAGFGQSRIASTFRAITPGLLAQLGVRSGQGHL
jgi:hypothetical protein